MTALNPRAQGAAGWQRWWPLAALLAGIALLALLAWLLLFKDTASTRRPQVEVPMVRSSTQWESLLLAPRMRTIWGDVEGIWNQNRRVGLV